MDQKALSLASPLARLHVESPHGRSMSSASSPSSLEDLEQAPGQAWVDGSSNGRSDLQSLVRAFSPSTMCHHILPGTHIFLTLVNCDCYRLRPSICSGLPVPRLAFSSPPSASYANSSSASQAKASQTTRGTSVVEYDEAFPSKAPATGICAQQQEQVFIKEHLRYR